MVLRVQGFGFWSKGLGVGLVFLLRGDEVDELWDFRLAHSVALCVASTIEFIGKTQSSIKLKREQEIPSISQKKRAIPSNSQEKRDIPSNS